MADIDSTATIEQAISHLPDDGGDTGDADLSPNDSGDTAASSDGAADDSGDAAANSGGAASETTSPGDEAAAALATPPKAEKKIPKWVPGHRFQAQTEAKQKAEARAAEIEAKYAEVEKDLPALREARAAFDRLESDVDGAVEILLNDPRYGKLLTRRQAEAIAEAATGAAPAARATPQHAAAAPTLGDPDIQLADGSLTYSPERLAKYVQDVGDHAASRAEANFQSALKELREEFGGRIKPFEQEVVDRQLNAKSEAEKGREVNALIEDYGSELVEEHKGAMKKWLHDQWGNPDPKTWRPTTQVKNKHAGTRDAERAVLLPALKAKAKAGRDDALKAADQAKARAIAEQNTRAAAAGEPHTSAGVSRGAKPQSPEDIINAAIDRAGIAA